MITLALLLTAMASQADAPPAAVASPPGLAAIDYARSGAIRDWYSEDDRGLFLRDRTNRWYYATFTAPCPGIRDSDTVGFDTNGFDRFDRTSRIVTQTMTCSIAALDQVAAPAAKGGKR